MLPGLQNNLLISVGKLVDMGYCTIFIPGGKGAQVYNANDSKVAVTGKSVLNGW